MHRFFISPLDLINEQNVVILSAELLHQFIDVLRFKEGEKIILLDNSGDEYLMEIIKISKKEISGKIIEKRKNEAEPNLQIRLFFALTKNQEKFEWVLQKGTEVGVSEFVPLITERTERQSLSKIDRLQRILKEAAEQSGRGIVPKLSEIKILKKLFTDEEIQKGKNILAHPEGKQSLKQVLEIKGVSEINIYIGPEGGFSPLEIENAEEAGFFVFNLGKKILRAETAAIVIPALTFFEFKRL